MNNRTIRIAVFTGMLACLSFLVSVAQPSLRSTIDRQEILIGEQFHLKVDARFSPGTHRITWISVPDTMNHFELVERSKLDSVYINNQFSGLTQTFTLTSFDSGKWVLPSFRMNLDPLNTGQAYSFLTDSFPMTVAFSSSDTTTALKDIKPIREVEVKSRTWYWIAAGVLLAALVGWVIWYSRRRRSSPAVPVARRPALSAYDEAMQDLDKLQQYNFADPVECKLVHTRVSEILKNYLSRRENDNFLNQTTGNVLILLKQFDVEPVLISQVAAALRLGDAVKFAKYLPEAAETSGSIEAVKALINSFKQKTPVPAQVVKGPQS